jgi:hypothetical protein
MFCVYAIVDIARWSGVDPAWGFVWYPLAIGTSWLLGWIVARWFSQPCERWLRRRYSESASIRPVAAVAPADV